MKLNCGIVGLPNVGKSTLFKALTAAPAEAANYPFCTIDPNIGIVAVPDDRLEKIAAIVRPQKTIHSTVEFVDIAGLVAGASKGEGLGNQFLGHIRQVGAIVHVLRCFEDDDIVHVNGKVDPISDRDIIQTELALSDLETVQRKKSSLEKMIKSQNKEQVKLAKLLTPILDRLESVLAEGQSARSIVWDEEDEVVVRDLHLLTMKPVLYACNVDESSLSEGNQFVEQVKEVAKQQGDDVVVISAEIESEISQLDSLEEKKEFLDGLGLESSGLESLIQKGYELLGLETYFTAGEKEVRAWTFKKGMKAPQAASVIHTDFEKGFIKAEVYHCSDLFESKSESKIKELGKLRIEGKEYVVKDGDVIHFRFNV